MIAVTLGTTSWRQTDRLAANEVEFTGAWLTDTDGLTPLMVWDAGLGNVRAMTAGELSARPAQRLAAAQALVASYTTVDIQTQPLAALVRAVVLLMLDEFNGHALKVNAILDAIDAAANLGQIKTAVAAIADLPPRTKAQLVTALVTKITGGDADT